jgi:hypothetical protein
MNKRKRSRRSKFLHRADLDCQITEIGAALIGSVFIQHVVKTFVDHRLARAGGEGSGNRQGGGGEGPPCLAYFAGIGAFPRIGLPFVRRDGEPLDGLPRSRPKGLSVPGPRREKCR